MTGTFNGLYGSALKQVFLELAGKELKQGGDGLELAKAYAERGKPEFALAYLLLIDVVDEVKREILARAYEQRAVLSEEQVENWDRKYRRPFPLVRAEAQKDRLAAQQVRQGKRIKTP